MTWRQKLIDISVQQRNFGVVWTDLQSFHLNSKQLIINYDAKMANFYIIVNGKV